MSRFVDIDTQKINPLAYLDDSNYSEVTPHANRYFEIIILEAAKKDNIDVLFDGFDGDSVLSYGYEYLNELGKNFNLITLINESKSINHQRTYLNIIKDHVIYPRISNDLLSFARFLRGKDPFQNRFKILNKNYKFIFQNQYNRHFGRKKISKTNVQEMHLATLEWPIWEIAMEFSYFDSLKYGIDERYPFFDKRIMEFCLSVPGKFRIKDGVSRYYFRKSMANYLLK